MIPLPNTIYIEEIGEQCPARVCLRKNMKSRYMEERRGEKCITKRDLKIHSKLQCSHPMLIVIHLQKELVLSKTTGVVINLAHTKRLH